MDILKRITLIEKEEKKYWSKDVIPKWTPPKGLFKENAKKIVDVLYKESDSLKTAMSRLNFYINRAGKKLPEQDKKELEKAKKLLREKFKKEPKKNEKKKEKLLNGETK